MGSMVGRFAGCIEGFDFGLTIKFVLRLLSMWSFTCSLLFPMCFLVSYHTSKICWCLNWQLQVNGEIKGHPTKGAFPHIPVIHHDPDH